MTTTIRVAIASCLALLLAWGLAGAQSTTEPDSGWVSVDKFDYAVPETPAFKLLTVDSDQILQPGTRRELSVAIQDANLKDYAIEFAPFLLARDGRIGLSAYKKKRTLYTTRFSLGIKQEDGVSRAAAGLRISLWDDGDPYMNKELNEAAFVAAEKIEGIRTEVTDSIGVLTLTKMKKDDAEALVEAKVKDRVRSHELLFEQARSKFKQQWRRRIAEIGLAMSGSEADSVRSKVHATGYAAWGTAGFPVGARGQVLLGAHWNRALVESDFFSSAGEGLRFYYGGLAGKVGATFDATASQHSRPTYVGSAVGELRISAGLWATASVGLHRDEDGITSFVPVASVRFALPGAIPGKLSTLLSK